MHDRLQELVTVLVGIVLMALGLSADAAKPDLDEETIVDEDLRKSVKQLREEGEKLYKEGKHDESVMTLVKALELLEEETG